MDYTKYTLVEVQHMLRTGKVSSVELVSQCIQNIEKNKDINAVLSYDKEYSLNQAKKADELLKQNCKGDLLGIPVIVKDNICTTEFKTTCASKFLENYVSPFDAFAVKKLKEAGAIIIGKANMDEFAMGGSGKNSAYGPTLNPVDKSRIPGGSSSGSAASVAANLCYCALGSDTGGSIRQPAGFCGVVGLKPTYGRVSRNGLVAFSSSLDQIGPIARSVEDTAIMLDVISGKDYADMTSVNQEKTNFKDFSNTDINGMTIGVVKEIDTANDIHPEINIALKKLIDFYKSKGINIVEVSLPNIQKSLAVYYILSSAEASSNLARFDGIKYGERAKEAEKIDDVYTLSRTKYFGKEVKRRIIIGNYVLCSEYYDAHYKKAVEVKELIKKEFKNAFKNCDAILCPTSPTTANKLCENKTPLQVYLEDIFTVPVNIFGGPAISFPIGKYKEKLPISCQLIGDMWQEKKILDLAYIYEKQGGNN